MERITNSESFVNMKELRESYKKVKLYKLRHEIKN